MAIGEGGVKKRLDVTWRECVKSNNLLNIYFIFRRKVHTCLFYTRIKLMQKKETISFKYQIIQFLHWENIEGKAGNLLFQYGKQNVSMIGTMKGNLMKLSKGIDVGMKVT